MITPILPVEGECGPRQKSTQSPCRYSVSVLAPLAAMSLMISTLNFSPSFSNSAIASSIETSSRRNSRFWATSAFAAASIFSRSSGVNGESLKKS